MTTRPHPAHLSDYEQDLLGLVDLADDILHDYYAEGCAPSCAGEVLTIARRMLTRICDDQGHDWGYRANGKAWCTRCGLTVRDVPAAVAKEA